MLDCNTPPQPAQLALEALWQGAGLPDSALSQVTTPGTEAVLPSSFDIATAAQASLGAAGAAAAALWRLRTGGTQQVTVDRRHATLACTGYFSLDGQVPDLWDKLSGLYPCGVPAGEAGWVRIHANFAHHRDGALRLLDLPPGEATPRQAVALALYGWSANKFEQAAADAGLVVAAARSFAEWDHQPQALAMAGEPVVRIDPLDGLPSSPRADWPTITAAQRPLQGLRVLDLTRILAGPVAGRLLASLGAEVMLVNGPHLPNIKAIADTSRGKLSALIDLREAAGRAQLDALAGQAQVLLQAYRPGALADHGFSPEALAQRHPGMVVASLSAYGDVGPWAGRRGFDSLVQTATGFNLAEAQAAGVTQPKALPLQILDYAAGQLLAFGIQAALWRQATQGGSWLVRVSLAGVGQWLRSLGRVAGGLAVQPPSIGPYLEDSPSGFGARGAGILRAVRQSTLLSATPAGWVRPAMPPGTHPPVWPVC